MTDQSHLDPVHLGSFLAVAETLHFTSAAQLRGISQSTISQHVSRLEEALETRLLARSTKTVRLTPAGEDLVVLARRMLQSESDIFARFSRGTPRGTIRLGVTEDLLLTRFPEVLRRFRATHPHLQVTLTVGLSTTLSRLLADSGLDVMCGMRRTTDTTGRNLWSEPLRWYAPDSARYPERSRGASLPLVTFPDGSVTRRAAIEALNRAGIAWHLAFTSDSLAAILAAMRAGYGVTVQPAFLADSPDIAACTPHPDSATRLPALPDVAFFAATADTAMHGPETLLITALEEHFAPTHGS